MLPYLLSLLRLDQLLIERDLLLVYLPNKTFWADTVRSFGYVPGWNPHIFAGTPFRAEMNLAALNPLNLIFLLFPAAKGTLALKFFVLAHFPLIAAASYYFFRTWQRPLASLLLTTLFCWSGCIASAFSLPHILLALTGTLLFFACWVRLERSGRSVYFAGAGAGLSLCIFGGDPQYTYLSFLALAFSLLLSGDRKIFLFRLKFLLSLSVYVFLLSAAQLLPTLGFLSGSTRSGDYLAADKMLRFSLHPARLIEVLLPGFFGSVGPAGGFWGARYVNGFTQPLLFSLYLGFSTIFALFVLAGLRLRQLWSFFQKHEK